MRSTSYDRPEDAPIYWPSSHYLKQAERARRNAARRWDPRLVASYLKSAETAEHLAAQQIARGL